MKKFRHSGKIGDVIASIPTVQAMGGGHYCLRESLDFSAEAIQALLPLLNAQKGLEASTFSGKTDINLDLMRAISINLDRSDLRKWPAFAFLQCPDLSKRFLKVKPAKGYADKLVINRSLRHRNRNISYRFIQNLPIDVVFLGTRPEFLFFKEKEVRKAKHIQTANLLEAAQIIAGSKAFVGNQSSPWWIAEGLGVPRLLEVCPACPNAIPMVKPIGRDALYQPAFEEHLTQLLKEQSCKLKK